MALSDEIKAILIEAVQPEGQDYSGYTLTQLSKVYIKQQLRNRLIARRVAALNLAQYESAIANAETTKTQAGLDMAQVKEQTAQTTIADLEAW